ncbi:ParB/RepB/Spo0J family partition protein [Leptothoe spongobia]|uniref:ParB/RepB/Spo0J family partition protein n=1 Tax=Leptothoe spongobia TAU-MAC 1115 TaxID=1967444 RepID=A0A947GKG1_9CYAN|nr:ParB/RepB/Spo0J family partition protein [Leptothoe spongobia]MBT9314081.1 ParB/RepB/Spo0J family partition protein [Leptothoe spongobia TAU-MAC 1115]
MFNDDLKNLSTTSTIQLSDGQSDSLIFPIIESQEHIEGDKQWLNKRRLDHEPMEQWLAVANIQPGTLQSRQYFDESEIDNLAKSFRENGFKGILNVRPLDNEQYELIAGERRWRAAQKAGIEKVLCLVNQFSDEEALQFSLIENVKRVDLSKLEETMAILRLIEIRYGLSQAQAAKIIRTEGHPDKRSRCDVAPSQALQNIESVLQSFNIELQTFRTRNLRSLTLSDELIQAHLKGQISWSVALELHKLKDAIARQTLLNEILNRESASFRWVQQQVKELRAQLTEPGQQTPVSFGKRIRAVAKQVKEVESQLNVTQRQQLETILQKLDDFLKHTDKVSSDSN